MSAGQGSAEQAPSSAAPAPPILVTGMPRSGTTWVCTMLDASGETVYVNEPLNPHDEPGWSPGVLRAPVAHQFQYIDRHNEAEFEPAYADLFALRYHALAQLRARPNPRDAARAGVIAGRFVRGRMLRRRVLVGDPYAAFSTEWLRRRFGVRTVFVVRHPAATVSSRKRLGWRLDFSELLDQQHLVDDRLGAWRERLEGLRHPHDDAIAEGGVLWALIHDVIARAVEADPSVIVVRHEDLSLAPVDRFEELYRTLGLSFGSRARRVIRSSTEGSNPAELTVGNPHGTRLDSRSNVSNWHHRLTAGEVERIRSLVAPVADRFYTDADWETA